MNASKNNFIVVNEGYFMHKRIMFRCMAHSDAIEKYISNKLSKLDKFFKRNSSQASIDIVLESHCHKHWYKVACTINSQQYHKTIHRQGMDMYMMIDQAIHKIIKDITRKKEQVGHHQYQLHPIFG